MRRRYRQTGPRLLDHPVIVRFDNSAERLSDRVRGNPLADRLFYAASCVGDHSLVWHCIGLATAIARPANRPASLRLSIALGFESALINRVVKLAFRRSRPAHSGPRPHYLRQPSTSSFPSGHATSAFCAATLLTNTFPRQRPLWFGLAAVVAVSRVYVRIHHASDILVGTLLGVLLGRFFRRVMPVAFFSDFPQILSSAKQRSIR